jgi:hypothetical protein
MLGAVKLIGAMPGFLRYDVDPVFALLRDWEKLPVGFRLGEFGIVWVVGILCLAAWAGIQRVGSFEFCVAGRLFKEGAFRRQMSAQIALRAYAARLDAAPTSPEYWAIVAEGLREFGFTSAQICVAGRTFEWRDNSDAESWELSVRIAENDNLRLSRDFASAPGAYAVAPFTDLLRKALMAKRADLVAGAHGVLPRA